MSERLKNLLSPFFIGCLVLLVLNDFVLKAVYHNMLTGKLSDFCGLIVFPIFWSAVFPKHKLSVFMLTALLFVWWKSAYASGFIEILNMPFNVRRTVDPTDLLTLPALLLAWIHIQGVPNNITNYNLVTRLSALFIGAIAFFSFCATSQQRSVKYLEQPQYVLLKSATLPDAYRYEEFDFYKRDSLLVIRVKYLYDTAPVRDDDYNKNRMIKDLDQDVVARISDSTNLIPSGRITSLTIATAEGKDSLRFRGGRLDGRFSRTKNHKLIIEGFYKMGLEDATWTLRDTSSTIEVKQTYKNGELTSRSQFDHGKLVSADSVNTRADTVRNKYVQIGVLILLVIGTLIWIVMNFRNTPADQFKLKPVWKWLMCMILPIFVWLTHTGIRILLMDFSHDIFEQLFSVILIYLVTCPLMFVVVFWIKLRKEVDVLLYCLLFGLLYSIWTTWGTLIALIN